VANVSTKCVRVNLDDLQVDVTWSLFACDQSLPSITALSNDLQGVLFVLAFTTEGELVLWLSVRDLVDSEPLIRRSEQPW
jgi:hypothetical protein